jgi:hypothetical protein
MLTIKYKEFKRPEDGSSKEHLVGWANIVISARMMRRLPAQARP